jgi:hypothetical protein
MLLLAAACSAHDIHMGLMVQTQWPRPHLHPVPAQWRTVDCPTHAGPAPWRRQPPWWTTTPCTHTTQPHAPDTPLPGSITHEKCWARQGCDNTADACGYLSVKAMLITHSPPNALVALLQLVCLAHQAPVQGAHGIPSGARVPDARGVHPEHHEPHASIHISVASDAQQQQRQAQRWGVGAVTLST